MTAKDFTTLARTLKDAPVRTITNALIDMYYRGANDALDKLESVGNK
jgi:hypothetical protein